MAYKKKNSWIIIFFLILLFMFINILDMTAISGTYAVKENYRGRITTLVTTPSQSPFEATPGSEVFKQFGIGKDSSGILQIDVSNAWISNKNINQTTLRLHYTALGDSWTELPITNTKRYTKETVIETSTIKKGEYAVTGEVSQTELTHTLPVRTQASILIAAIIVIITLTYIKLPKGRKYDAQLLELENQMRQQLLQGRKEEQLKDEYLAKGYKEQQIAEALKKIRYF